MKLVLVESPFSGETERNVIYARKCLADCFKRGEYPFASHLLYTQPGVLDDTNSKERELGIEAGLVWGAKSDATVVYLDHGITSGMEHGINRAKKEKRKIEYRYLY